MAVEELQYTLIEQFDDIEIRQYAPYIVAETTVSGGFDRVGNVAFRRLAGYIFGKNRRRRTSTPAATVGADAEKIAMTAPVLQKPDEGKIAMTAPVTQTGGGNSWEVAFAMPSSYSMETLPEPLDADIRLEQRPAQLMAALIYSGSWRKSSFDKKRKELEQQIVNHGYVAIGPAMFARYNPPYTLWFKRRNEVLIPVVRA